MESSLRCSSFCLVQFNNPFRYNYTWTTNKYLTWNKLTIKQSRYLCFSPVMSIYSPFTPAHIFNSSHSLHLGPIQNVDGQIEMGTKNCLLICFIHWNVVENVTQGVMQTITLFVFACVCSCRTTHLALCAWLCLCTAAWSPECVVSWGWQSVLNTGHSDSDFIPINEALSLSTFTYLHHCSAGPAWTTWSWDSTALLGGCGVYF